MSPLCCVRWGSYLEAGGIWLRCQRRDGAPVLSQHRHLAKPLQPLLPTPRLQHVDDPHVVVARADHRVRHLQKKGECQLSAAPAAGEGRGARATGDGHHDRFAEHDDTACTPRTVQRIRRCSGAPGESESASASASAGDSFPGDPYHPPRTGT
jgi:hypothetical protein